MARKKAVWSPRDIATASAAEARRSAKPKASEAAGPAKRQTPGVGQAALMAQFRALPTGTRSAAPTSRRESAVAAPKPEQPPALSTSADAATQTAIEVGARAIYEFRSHPKKRSWDAISEEERAPYRDRMKRLSAEIGEAGFQIRRG